MLRYRFFLEQNNLAPSTINMRLAAVRRLAYEAADTGLLSPELAAGIRRVKGAKRLGVRIGNWLTVEQSKKLLPGPAGRNRSGQARSGHPGFADRVRASASRTCRAEKAGFPDPGGTLGRCRLDRKGESHSNRAGTGMGETCRRRLAQRGWLCRRSHLSSGEPARKGVGRRNHAEGNLAHR